MINKALTVLVLIACAGCSAVPYKVPLTDDARAKVQGAEVNAGVSDRGIGVQYMAQDSSAAGAPYGLIGTIVTATIDAAYNAGPAGVAQDTAEKLAVGYETEELQSELVSALRAVLRDTPCGAAASVTKIRPDQKLTVKDLRADNVLVVQLHYALAEDFRSLQVVGDALLLSKTAADTSVPQGVEPGTVYRNRFEYWSAPLPAPPTRTQAEIDAAVAAVEAKYANTSKDQQAERRAALAEAHDPSSPRVSANFMVRHWLANDGARLRDAIRSGTAEIMNLLAADLADPRGVDVKTKLPDTTIVREQDGRIVKRKNIGAFIGSLVSTPKDYIAPPANAVAYRAAEKASAPKTAAR